jgi:hypothetical protein
MAEPERDAQVPGQGPQFVERDASLQGVLDVLEEYEVKSVEKVERQFVQLAPLRIGVDLHPGQDVQAALVHHSGGLDVPQVALEVHPLQRVDDLAGLEMVGDGHVREPGLEGGAYDLHHRKVAVRV